MAFKITIKPPRTLANKLAVTLKYRRVVRAIICDGILLYLPIKLCNEYCDNTGSGIQPSM